MAQTIAERRLLTRPEAAEYLRLSDKTLSRWAWAGRGPRFVKIGGAVRYDLADLDAFIEAGRRNSTSQAA